MPVISVNSLSFGVRVMLQGAVTVLGVIAVAYSYVGIPIGLLGAILLVSDVLSHYAERGEFKKKIVLEALSIVEHMIATLDPLPILYPVWSISFKPDILGENDLTLWEAFYDAIEQRNQYLGPRQMYNPGEFTRHNRAIFDSFVRVYDALPWVQAAVTRERMDSLRLRVQHSASL
jgi:hypothetical protein